MGRGRGREEEKRQSVEEEEGKQGEAEAAGSVRGRRPRSPIIDGHCPYAVCPTVPVC